MLCPICEAPSVRFGSPLPSGRRLGLHECGTCGHRFGAPSDFDAATAYDDPHYMGFRPDPYFEAAARACFEKAVTPYVPSGARVLDVGCGNGAVLRVVTSLGLLAQGIDVSEAAVQHCRDLGLSANVGDFPTHDFAGQRFSVITFWDVLEHLSSPQAFVRRAGDLLEPGGLLLAKVPGHKSLSVRLSSWVPRLAGAVLQVPHHLQLFTDASLRRLVADDFQVVSLVEPGRMRSPAQGGPLKRRVARQIVSTVHRVSGDRGLLLIAQKKE